MASEAFWSFVFDNGWKATGFPENIEDIPKKLWSREMGIEALISSKAATRQELSNNLVNRIYYAIAVLRGFTFQSGNGESCTGEIVSKSNFKNKSVFKKLASLFQ